MISCLSFLATWGPCAYHACMSTDTLVTAAIYNKESAELAKDVFPEVFAKEPKLRQDTIVCRTPHARPDGSFGTSFGPTPILLINKELLSLDPDVTSYMSKYALFQIHSNSSFVERNVAAGASAVSTFAMPYLQSCLPWWAAPLSYCVPFCVGGNIHILAMSIFDERATLFAVRNASDKELFAYERFLRGQIKVNRSLHATYPNRFSADGNLRFEFTHRPLTARLRTLSREYQNRKILGERPVKQDAKMQEFHRNQYKNVFKLKVD